MSDDALCTCGHTAHWHSHSGAGDCEHDGECKCPAFTAVDRGPLEPLIVGWPIWLCPVCQEIMGRDGEDAHCAAGGHESTPMTPLDVVQMDLARTLVGQNRRLRAALPDPGKLFFLADWLDGQDIINDRVGRDEVQRDLRRWANAAITAHHTR